MGLSDRLILSAHHAVRHQGAAGLGHQRRDDGVQRALARRDAIRMAGLDTETAGAILQENASLVRHDRRAEGMCDRVDEGTDVAVLVHHGDVYRRRIHRRRHVGQFQQPVHPDLADIFVGEVFRQNPDHVDIDLGRIADVLLAHHIGDPRGFGLEMKPLDAERLEFRQIEMRQDVEHHQHGDAGPVRRALPDVEAFIHGADRGGGFGGVRGEVVERVQAPDSAQGLDHVLGDRALVKRVAAVFRDCPQRLGKLGLMDDIASHRRLAVRQQIAPGVGAFFQLVELVLPVERDARRDHIAFFRGLDRGLQQAVEPELAVIAQDHRPGIDRAGNGDGMRRGQRDRLDVVLEIPLGRRGHRGAAGAVVGNDLALAPRLNQREAIAADAGRLRLDHP